jgi:hypothetical protein
LLKMEVENSLRKLGFDETHIEKIQNRVGKANGYAYLAEIKIAQGNLKDALKLVEKGLLCDGMSIWLMRLRVSLLRKLSPDDHKSIVETLDDYAAVSIEKYDVELSFESAKETYMAGDIVEAKKLFRDLSKKAANHPRKLIPREPEDRWIEKGKPKRLNGTITKLPTENLYGSVQTTFPRTFADSLIVRKPDLRYAVPSPSVGDRVSYEIVFNMLGPEASKVNRL